VLAGFDRLERELDGGQYLVGGRYTVADLTAAALLYPIVLPPEGPLQMPLPERFDRFRAGLADRPGFRYVREMFSRHRAA
jgi:glutathione S-transferase